VEVTIQDWSGFIGQWDTRQWKPRPDSTTVRDANGSHQAPLRKSWAVSANHAHWNLEDRGTPYWAPRYPDDYLGLVPGYIKHADLAWYVSHHHTPEGLNEPYAYSYLFVHAIELPDHAAMLTLPTNERIRILAISVAHEEPAVTPATPLYDTLDQTGHSLFGHGKEGSQQS
jgi:alpha-mannosidase